MSVNLYFPDTKRDWTSLVAQMVKNLQCRRTGFDFWVWSLGQEDPLKHESLPTPVILAWRIPWTEGTVGLLSVGLQRICKTERLILSLFTFFKERLAYFHICLLSYYSGNSLFLNFASFINVTFVFLTD